MTERLEPKDGPQWTSKAFSLMHEATRLADVRENLEDLAESFAGSESDWLKQTAAALKVSARELWAMAGRAWLDEPYEDEWRPKGEATGSQTSPALQAATQAAA